MQQERCLVMELRVAKINLGDHSKQITNQKSVQNASRLQTRDTNPSRVKTRLLNERVDDLEEKIKNLESKAGKVSINCGKHASDFSINCCDWCSENVNMLNERIEKLQ